MKISDIIHYPVKSLAGVHNEHSFLENRGLSNDRRFMIVDAQGKFITQRKYPQLSQIGVGLNEENLILKDRRSDEMIMSPIDLDLQKTDVQVWRSKVTSHLLINNEVEAWLSERLEEKVRLVYMDESDHRHMNPDFASKDELVSFADGYPVLIVNTASLERLNQELSTKVNMDRFRANIVVEGTKAWEENSWKKVKIGEAVLRVAKPCARCKVIDIDQQSAQVGKEVLPTLGKISRDGDKVIFGINCIVEKEGAISLKDELEILE